MGSITAALKGILHLVTDTSFLTVFSPAMSLLEAWLFPHQVKEEKKKAEMFCLLWVFGFAFSIALLFFFWLGFVCCCFSLLLHWVMVADWDLIKSAVRAEECFWKCRDSYTRYLHC